MDVYMDMGAPEENETPKSRKAQVLMYQVEQREAVVEK